MHAEGRAQVYGKGQPVLGADIGGHQHDGTDADIGQQDNQNHGRKRHAAADPCRAQ